MKLCPLIISSETARVSNGRFDSEIFQSTKLWQYTVGTHVQKHHKKKSKWDNTEEIFFLLYLIYEIPTLLTFIRLIKKLRKVEMIFIEK